MTTKEKIYQSVNEETNDFFLKLSKNSNSYCNYHRGMSEYGFSKEDLTPKKTYSIPISPIDRCSFSKKYYQNIEHCFNYLKKFCDTFEIPFNEFKSMIKTRENQNYRMAFAWCSVRMGFDRFVIAEVMYKSKEAIDYYISKMNDFRYIDSVTKQISDPFQIVNQYEKV